MTKKQAMATTKIAQLIPKTTAQNTSRHANDAVRKYLAQLRLRVSRRQEEEGLDLAIHGEEGYQLATNNAPKVEDRITQLEEEVAALRDQAAKQESELENAMRSPRGPIFPGQQTYVPGMSALRPIDSQVDQATFEPSRQTQKRPAIKRIGLMS